MKRPSPYLWLRQERIARYRARERSLRVGRRRVLPENRYVPPGALIVAPRSFDLLRGSGVEVIKFLRAVAGRVLGQGLPVRLDFRLTETFFVPATVLLFAEIDRIVALAAVVKPVSVIDPIARKPREVLKQIGLHELTGDSSDVVPEREDVVYWKATKGSNQSGDRLAVLEVVAQKVNKAHAKILDVSGIWRGVSEAVANTVDHAYVLPRGDGYSGEHDTKWWMFTQVKEPFFTAAVCDLGCGYRATINNTLPEWIFAQAAQLFQGANPDAQAIHTAMEYGRSGSHKGHRGKGSRDALSVLEHHGTGELVVMSNTGWMRYEFSPGKEVIRRSGDLRLDIKGTIVWWKLPLKGNQHDHR